MSLLATFSVSGSGGIFGTVPVPGSHLPRALWAGIPYLLVSINAFCVTAFAAELAERSDANSAKQLWALPKVASIMPQQPSAVKQPGEMGAFVYGVK